MITYVSLRLLGENGSVCPVQSGLGVGSVEYGDLVV
jgi:hypothetical protein